jgi:hypothetical protein
VASLAWSWWSLIVSALLNRLMAKCTRRIKELAEISKNDEEIITRQKRAFITITLSLRRYPTGYIVSAVLDALYFTIHALILHSHEKYDYSVSSRTAGKWTRMPYP